jgi:hypothetical protein
VLLLLALLVVVLGQSAWRVNAAGLAERLHT